MPACYALSSLLPPETQERAPAITQPKLARNRQEPVRGKLRPIIAFPRKTCSPSTYKVLNSGPCAHGSFQCQLRARFSLPDFWRIFFCSPSFPSGAVFDSRLPLDAAKNEEKGRRREIVLNHLMVHYSTSKWLELFNDERAKSILNYREARLGVGGSYCIRSTMGTSGLDLAKRTILAVPIP